MTYREAIDEALCYGWIDGLIRRVDAASYTHRFTPRMAGSIWSNINLGHVARLTAAGRMHPAGLAAFNARTAAKAGVYSFERKQPAELPSAFDKKFRASTQAWAFFHAQPPGYRRLALHFVICAKQEATRLRRLERLVAGSAAGRRIGLMGWKPLRLPASKKPREVVCATGFISPRAGKIPFLAHMIFSRRVLLLLVLSLSPGLFAAANRAKPSSPDNATAYKGAIVVDAATGNVLFEDRADYSGAPASMAKLMTFAVLDDKLAAGSLALDAPVRIANEDNIGGTQVFLDPRETFPVEELIFAMMIQSANDAARSLARFSAGSVAAFVGQMNAKARELGMTHTTFRSPHGLPPASRRAAEGDLTTPRDFALLCRHLLQKTDVLKYTSVRSRDFGPQRAKGPMKMENHNKLLGKVTGVDGLKTGFTDAAGYCTSVTALRGGRRVIVVVMGSLGPGGQRDLGKTRDLKVVELLERGFAALPAAAAAPVIAAAPKEISVIKPAPRTPAPVEAPAEPLVKFSLPKK